ncbi:hypothetical protein UXO11_22365 [Enterobacter wuhouensis]|uniref:hypothetical protein n=1 Tax=Enterobacter wuhouensis TaxID=2529381 RepID=UPI002FD5BC9F
MRIKPYVKYLLLALLFTLPVSALLYRKQHDPESDTLHCTVTMSGVNGNVIMAIALSGSTPLKGNIGFKGVYNDGSGNRITVSREVIFAYQIQHSVLLLTDIYTVKDKRDAIDDHDFKRLVFDTDKKNIELTVRRNGNIYLFSRNISPTFFCAAKTS